MSFQIVTFFLLQNIKAVEILMLKECKMLQEKPVKWLTVNSLIYAVVDLTGHLITILHFKVHFSF